MLIRFVKYFFLLAVIMTSYPIFAQTHLKSEVKINQSSVYVGQAVQVSLGVYTTTWFTRGINPGNIKVPGAFTVYFRSVSQTKKFNGKNYAGVELIFNIFPYDDEDIIFPALEIEVETPDEGGFKGVKRIVKTSERKISVKSIPKGYHRDEWLVALGMTVNESWSGNVDNVKVGDVLERTISRKVSGTVAELVPPIVWDTLDGASLYPSRSEVSSDKTKTSISASRSDGMRYLFEKEGTIVIPEMVLTWWNPDKKKLFKRSLKSQIINVKPNPDLGMLETMRDSLALSIEPQEMGGDIQEESGPSLKQIISWTIIGLIISYIIFRLLHWLFIKKDIFGQMRKRRQQYLQSEKYFFRQFIKASHKNNTSLIIQSLYKWLDKLELQEPTANYFASTYGNEELLNEVFKLSESAHKSKPVKLNIHIESWKKARINFLKAKLNPSAKADNWWINP